jgi:hypothetical protein
MEQDSRIHVSKFNGNEPTQETIECLASMAKLLCPKKRNKVEEFSTITIAYMKNKRPDLINKKFVRHWKRTESKSSKWSTKGGSFKTNRKCDIEFTLPAFQENRTITCNAYC